jgi:hypothetical protein
MMSERVKVGQVDQLAPGKGKLVKAKGHEIALFNVDGSFTPLVTVALTALAPWPKGVCLVRLSPVRGTALNSM